MKKKQSQAPYRHRHTDLVVSLYIAIVSVLFLLAHVSAVGGTWAHQWTMDVDLSTADASYLGEASGDLLGLYSAVGDVNADGYADMILSGSGNDQVASHAGKAYIMFGAASGLAMNTVATGTAVGASFLGEAASDAAGQSVKMVGDVNGDGIPDIAVGARQNDEGASNGGQVYVIFGKTSGWSKDVSLGSAANASFLGKDANDQFGGQTAGVGDVNADGFADFVMCSNVDDDVYTNAGQCYLILGKATASWAMDQNVGTAGVISEGYTGTGTENLLGQSEAGIGDVNGDGFSDFALGATGNDDAGTDRGHVYIIFGKSSGWSGTTSSVYSAAGASYRGENNSDFAGFDVSGLGDVNGDGLDDFAIVSSEYDNGATADVGKVYIIFGKRSGWSKDVSLSNADASYLGEVASDKVEYVAKAGDVNNDGYKDILVGDEFNDDNGVSAGQTYVIFGKSSGWSNNVSLGSANASFWGEAASNLAGRRIADGGDVNGDGASDILIGASTNAENGTTSGQAYLLLSQRPPSVSISSVSTATDGSGYVFVTSSVSDVNSFSQAMRVNYRLGTNCVSSTSASTLLSTVTVAYTDTGGAPTVTSNAFQVGSETNKKIITSSGANTVGVVWNSKIDIPTADATYCVALTVTDSAAYSNVASTTLTIDNVQPTPPASLTPLSVTAATTKFDLGLFTSTETNFKEYKILYATTTPVATSTFALTFTSSSDSNLGRRDLNIATSSTVTGLTSNTKYYFNIAAYDTFGYTSIGLAETNTTTLAAVPSSLSLSSDSQNRITASWSANGNPSGTEYYVENTAKGTHSGWITDTSWVSDGLVCNAGYTIRVKARNSAGHQTAWVTSHLTYPMACQGGGGSGGGGGASAVPAISSAQETSVLPITQFTIETPADMVVISTLPFDVTGRADPGSRVAVEIAGSKYTASTTSDGRYAVSVLDALTPGAYTMTVVRTSENGATQSLTRAITYVPASAPREEDANEKASSAETPAVGAPPPQKKSGPPADRAVPAAPKKTQPIAALPPPTKKTVEDELKKVEERRGFMLVMKETTVPFRELQVRPIEAVGGEKISVLIRPTMQVKSITARLYPLNGATTADARARSQRWRWIANLFASPADAKTESASLPKEKWIDGYLFSPMPHREVYAGDITVPFVEQGTYALRVTMNAADGTRSSIEKRIMVIPHGIVYSGSPASLDDRVSRARVTVFARGGDEIFREWNGGAFGANHPVWTDEAGQYAVSLPAGAYYVRVDADGYESYQSGVKVLSRAAILNDAILLSPKQKTGILWEWWNRLWR